MLRMSGLASARVSRPFDIGVLHNHSRTAFDVPYPTPKSRETETGEAQSVLYHPTGATPLSTRMRDNGQMFVHRHREQLMVR